MCLDYKVMAEPSIENDLYGVEQYGLVKKRSSLWNSIEINLYPEFENTQDAIKNFITFNSSILFEIESKIGMKIINVDSFFDFLEMYSLYIEENELYESRPEEMLFRKELLKFADIVENEEKNTEIENLLVSQDIDISSIDLCLPHSNYHENNNLGNRDFNISNGITYATTWAISHNPNYYNYHNGDCAHFCSQILEAGGVLQYYTGGENTGWWHLNNANHDSSKSWRLADNFSKYYGMYLNTSSHYAFNICIRTGSFIALDYKNDGDWDHVGFVTGKDSSYSSTLGYTDYRVAQHSTWYEGNYNTWASNNVNQWETYNDGICRYGMILY